MQEHRISPTTLTAVLVVTTAALIGRTWLQVEFSADGMPTEFASHVSFAVVPIILVLLLFPLWRSEKAFLRSLYRTEDLSWRVALLAFGIGLLMLLVWWCQIVAGTAFGLYRSDNPNAIVGPRFGFVCDPIEQILLGLIVMAVFVPIIEEITHRAYVMTFLAKRGFALSAILSSLVFMVFHTGGTWPVAFLAGLIFAVMYWKTGSLWYSTIAHATFNAHGQFPWRCLSIQWSPTAAQLPKLGVGFSALAILFVAVAAIVWMLFRAIPGRQPPRKRTT